MQETNLALLASFDHYVSSFLLLQRKQDHIKIETPLKDIVMPLEAIPSMDSRIANHLRAIVDWLGYSDIANEVSADTGVLIEKLLTQIFDSIESALLGYADVEYVCSYTFGSKRYEVGLGPDYAYIKERCKKVDFLLSHLQGYKVKTVLNENTSGFLVTCPSGNVRFIHGYDCGCLTYFRESHCRHLDLLSTYRKHRNVLGVDNANRN